MCQHNVVFHILCLLQDVGSLLYFCVVATSSEHKKARLICNVEEYCDDVQGLVCRTTCEEVSQFNWGDFPDRPNPSSLPNCSSFAPAPTTDEVANFTASGEEDDLSIWRFTNCFEDVAEFTEGDVSNQRYPRLEDKVIIN